MSNSLQISCVSFCFSDITVNLSNPLVQASFFCLVKSFSTVEKKKHPASLLSFDLYML